MSNETLRNPLVNRNPVIPRCVSVLKTVSCLVCRCGFIVSFPVRHEEFEYLEYGVFIIYALLPCSLADWNVLFSVSCGEGKEDFGRSGLLVPEAGIG